MRSVVTHLPSASPPLAGEDTVIVPSSSLTVLRAVPRSSTVTEYSLPAVYIHIHVPAVVHAGEAFVIQGFDICRFAVPRRRRRVVRLRGEACGVRQHKRSQYSE